MGLESYSWRYYILFSGSLVGGVVEVAGNEGHFERSAGFVGRNFGGGDEKEATFVNKEFGLLGVVRELRGEEGDSFLGFFRDATSDFDVTGAAEWVVEIFARETSVG